MDNQRLFLVIALSLILVMLWQAWERDQRPASPPPTTSAPDAGVPSAPKTDATISAPRAAESVVERGQRVRVTTDVIDATIDTIGGDVRELFLRTYPVSIEKREQPFQLLRDEGAELFIMQSGLLGNDGVYPNHKTAYRADRDRFELAAGADRIEVPLTWRDGALTVTKILTFHRNSYAIDVRYEIHNGGNSARTLYGYAQFVRSHVAESNYLTVIPSYTGGAIYSPEKKYQKIDFADIADKWPGRDVTGGWVGMLQHYFVGAIIPPAEAPMQFYGDTLGAGRYIFGLKNLRPTPLPPAATARLEYRYYLGPKEQDRLEKIAPGLQLTVDYGWLTVIAAPLFWILKWLHDFTGNWGWAIVLLTFLIKLMFYPLSAASYKSMAHMRKVQPRLAALKERFGNDRQKMSQAMMEMYKTEKINPLGGCLPILIQIPVFIALYWVLLESVELRQAPFILWIHDLSIPDPYFVLPILMGATMLIQQTLNPAPLDPIQKKIMYALPVLFTVFFLFFASGLVLYWTVNNILSIAQQWWITHRIETGKT